MPQAKQAVGQDFKDMVVQLNELHKQAEEMVKPVPAKKFYVNRPRKEKPVYLLIMDCDCDCIEKCEYDGDNAIKCFSNRE